MRAWRDGRLAPTIRNRSHAIPVVHDLDLERLIERSHHPAGGFRLGAAAPAAGRKNRLSGRQQGDKKDRQSALNVKAGVEFHGQGVLGKRDDQPNGSGIGMCRRAGSAQSVVSRLRQPEEAVLVVVGGNGSGCGYDRTPCGNSREPVEDLCGLRDNSAPNIFPSRVTSEKEFIKGREPIGVGVRNRVAWVQRIQTVRNLPGIRQAVRIRIQRRVRVGIRWGTGRLTIAGIRCRRSGFQTTEAGRARRREVQIVQDDWPLKIPEDVKLGLAVMALV